MPCMAAAENAENLGECFCAECFTEERQFEMRVQEVFNTFIGSAFDKVIQPPPTPDELRDQNKIVEEKFNPNQRKAVELLQQLTKEKGGQVLVTKKESNRPSCLDYLSIIFGSTWKDDEVVQAKKNILLLTLKEDDFDTEGDFQFPCADGDTQTRGGMVYQQPSSDWVRVGLRVIDRYDEGNNDWLTMDEKNPKQWAVGFHGSSREGLQAIASTREFIFREGQLHRNKIDVNDKSNRMGKACGPGVYFAESISVPQRYSEATGGTSSIGTPIVLQVRIKPCETRIPKGEPGYRIVNDPKYIRPYGLCVRKSTND